MVVDILKIILTKKIPSKVVYFGRNWIFSEKLVQNWSKLQLLKTKTTSSSSTFCADFKTARLFDPRTVTRPENRVFLSQGGTKIQFLKHQKFSFLRVVFKAEF